MIITSDNIKDFLTTASVVVVAAFLAVALYHLIALLKKLNGVIGTNEKNIEDTLAKLPETIGNINSAVTDVKAITQKANAIVGSVESSVSGVVAGAKGTTSNVLEITRTLVDIIAGVSGFFSRRKKEPIKDDTEG